jgi:hypothetical protein
MLWFEAVELANRSGQLLDSNAIPTAVENGLDNNKSRIGSTNEKYKSFYIHTDPR